MSGKRTGWKLQRQDGPSVATGKTNNWSDAMSKGSGRRPGDGYGDGWDAIFGKKPEPVKEQK